MKCWLNFFCFWTWCYFSEINPVVVPDSEMSVLIGQWFLWNRSQWLMWSECKFYICNLASMTLAKWRHIFFSNASSSYSNLFWLQFIANVFFISKKFYIFKIILRLFQLNQECYYSIISVTSSLIIFISRASLAWDYVNYCQAWYFVLLIASKSLLRIPGNHV